MYPHTCCIYVCFKSSCLLISSVLPSSGYIGEFELIDDHRSGKIVVTLNGRLNNCGVISPRFDIRVNEIEKWASNLLPSRQFGYVCVYMCAYIHMHVCKHNSVCSLILICTCVCTFFQCIILLVVSDNTVGIKKCLHCDPQYVRITYVLLCAITLRNNREYHNYVV